MRSLILSSALLAAPLWSCVSSIEPGADAADSGIDVLSDAISEAAFDASTDVDAAAVCSIEVNGQCVSRLSNHVCCPLVASRVDMVQSCAVPAGPGGTVRCQDNVGMAPDFGCVTSPVIRCYQASVDGGSTYYVTGYEWPAAEVAAQGWTELSGDECAPLSSLPACDGGM